MSDPRVISEQECERLVSELADQIRYPHDGPVTEHVAVTRALEIARTKQAPVRVARGYGVDPVAEALLLVLPECEPEPDPCRNTADGWR